ncbi:type II secretion system GspH family protein [Blastopirellula sp. J2-11]|uniref:PulJ/GspJ family protein n=1 Tax=Blastopirellula sp. J2-11 TaxID=2943192 RepID=UPI0021C92F35|nr:prepilin-type N-terminal cleavage/methylation domain-containing protein [Blastopirellula sp. J2-11]UUO08871.1 type II secretion system GspH family protein [Blastopirellula sp. J2-11]
MYRQAPKRPKRRGMTLAEMLVATAIMGMMAAALSTIALAVQMAHEYAADQGVMAQHARVIIERIQRAFSGATASESFPGAKIITYYDSTYPFPQAIAIWNPETIALDPDGSPLIGELKFFASDPSEPNRLLEFQATGDARPAPTTAAAWRDLVEELLDNDDVEKIELTDLIAAPKLVAGGARSYSTLRFEMRLRPDEAEVADMRDGLKTWASLRWPQRSYGPHSGTRQSWVAFQFQVAPDATAAQRSSVDVEAAPFFGSASLYYTLNQ